MTVLNETPAMSKEDAALPAHINHSCGTSTHLRLKVIALYQSWALPAKKNYAKSHLGDYFCEKLSRFK